MSFEEHCSYLEIFMAITMIQKVDKKLLLTSPEFHKKRQYNFQSNLALCGYQDLLPWPIKSIKLITSLTLYKYAPPFKSNT